MQGRSLRAAEPEMSTAVVVLAAGSGSRFGGRKLIADFKGRPLLQRAIDAACGSRARICVLVLGADSESVLDRVESRRCSIVLNGAWPEGIASSIRTGLALALEFDACVFMLADQPFVTSANIDSLCNAAGVRPGDRQRPPPIVALRMGRAWGSPVLFPRHDFAALERLEGDAGAKRYAQSQTRRLRFVTAGDPRAFCDIDSPADLRALRV
ncbi:MAG TPA: nucleotidyltransferase family protein [Candidatus Eremiobacteraceae bacterium]